MLSHALLSVGYAAAVWAESKAEQSGLSSCALGHVYCVNLPCSAPCRMAGSLLVHELQQDGPDPKWRIAGRQAPTLSGASRDVIA